MHSRLKYPGLEDCAGTTYFTALVNDLFDALNAKLPVRGVKEGSEKITVSRFFKSGLATSRYSHDQLELTAVEYKQYLLLNTGYST